MITLPGTGVSIRIDSAPHAIAGNQVLSGLQLRITDGADCITARSFPTSSSGDEARAFRRQHGRRGEAELPQEPVPRRLTPPSLSLPNAPFI